MMVPETALSTIPEENEDKSVTLSELTGWIQRQHQKCQNSPTTTLPNARNIGEWLLAAENVLTSEQWPIWLKQECQLSESNAQMYMAIARSWVRLGKPIVVARDTVTFDQEPQPPIPPNASPITSSPTRDQIEPSINLTSQPPVETFAIPPSTTECLKISFFIPGNIVPKARPRVTVNGTYLPKRYRTWRNRAEGELILQIARQERPITLPIPKATVNVYLTGKHRQTADADNLVGSCLDALVAVGVFPNDSLSHIQELHFKFVPDGDLGAQILIFPHLDYS